MQMAEAKDEWMMDDLTPAEGERETAAREMMMRALCELVISAVPATRVLVVVRSHGLPLGAIREGAAFAPQRELDPVVLAELLSVASDDRNVSRVATLILGPGCIEHAVARDRSGDVVGVVAVLLEKSVARNWLRVVLTRGADTIASWCSTVPPSPTQALIDGISEPMLVHDRGIVLVANAALANALDMEQHDIAGMPVGRITHRLETACACSIAIGNRSHPALIFVGRHANGRATPIEIVDRVVAQRYPFIRHDGTVALNRTITGEIDASNDSVEEIVTLALLDAHASFSTMATANHIDVNVRREGPWFIIEVIAAGELVAKPSAEHIGAVVCAARTRALGGQYSLDSAQPGRRLIRVSLPVAV